MYSNLKILLIEDDLVDQMAFTRIVNSSIPGSTIHHVMDIAEAEKSLKSNTFDWIISDFNLPDGTLRDIISYAKNNKMICVSGDLPRSRIVHLKAEGLVEFLIKDQQLNYLHKILEIIQNNHKSPQLKDEDPKDALQLLMDKFDQNKALVAEIIELFEQNGKSDIEELHSSVERQDSLHTHKLAHKMKSSYRVLGFIDSFNLLERIEIACSSENNNWLKIGNDLNTLFEQYATHTKSMISWKEKLNLNE